MVCHFHEIDPFFDLIDDYFKGVIRGPCFLDVDVDVDLFDLVRVEGAVAIGECLEKLEGAEMIEKSDIVSDGAEIDWVD